MIASTLIEATVGALILVLLGLSLRHSRNADHELQNGTTSALGRIEDRQIGQDRRMERVESKVDRAHARLNDHIEQADRRFNKLEGRS